MHGKLFTVDFLSEGIKATTAWRAIDDEAFGRFRAALQARFGAFRADSTDVEATTESEIILPVLHALGWSMLPQQKAASRRLDIPDVLLFAAEADKAAALAVNRDEDRWAHGTSFCESKRWNRPLGRADADAADAFDQGSPDTQMLRYLSSVELASDGRMVWGLLTNGRRWRLYWRKARSKSEDFLELDLAAIVGMAGIQPDLGAVEALNPEHFLRVFYVLFRPQAFVRDESGRSFHETIVEDSREWERRVTQELGEVVFHDLFGLLIAALAKHDPAAPTPLTPAYLAEVRDSALIYLYRLLFLLYAEDRNLLPTSESRYDDYALRAIRRDIRERIDKGDTFSDKARRYHDHVGFLFEAIAVGDSSIGIPPYNGGLFDPERHALLARTELPDSVMAHVIDRLSRWQSDGERRWINYRDLSVQHLGAVYERLLEYRAVLSADGGIDVTQGAFARRVSGSYYTHDDLVQLLLRETLGPLIHERVERFRAAVERLAGDKRPHKAKLAELAQFDPAEAMLGMRICDPAMGSGHFLVSLVDVLADEILEQIETVPGIVPWADAKAPYRSPLEHRFAEVRARILENAEREGWLVDEQHLDDRHIVRRMILKRTIFGVDKNPMAVELAKVALWLHTFTVGAPLSFLDHHLRVGDSLFGGWVRGVEYDAQRAGALFQSNLVQALKAAAAGMDEITRLTDADIAEVQASKRWFSDLERQMAPLNRLLDFWHALRWFDPVKASRHQWSKIHPGLNPITAGDFGPLTEVLTAGHVEGSPRAADVNALLERTRHLAGRERFLHWELAFPTVWDKVASRQPEGGFDAVIGNPPWDRMKLQQVEWFAERRREIAVQTRAADRKRAITALEAAGDPLWADYQEACEAAESAMAVARTSGDYPLLGHGDLNLYSLFVERAQRLVRPDGIVGLLVPSGIAGDLGAADFFRSIATTGRLGALFDFENRRTFFPDVHASFKFSALVFGGAERRFAESRCSFFIQRIADLADPERVFPLAAEDFAVVNPNTGTAPVFRTRRDAELTTRIYRNFPVLVDRRGGQEKRLWPVRYSRMFDMTLDSKLFKRRDELEAEGFYPAGRNVWKKGAAEYVPLYEGKMVQMYDHRAASVTVNPANVNRPAGTEPATPEQLADPAWQPAPQFWVPADEVRVRGGQAWAIGFKDVTAPTNARTMIAAAVPGFGFGNTLPALTADGMPAADLALALANLGSMVYDYLARQKVQGQHLNLYIIEQLAMIPRKAFDGTLGGVPIVDAVCREVLRLTYTAHDMAPFARDLGYDGPPFAWDAEDRRHRMARLDALFFHLYGLSRDEADYVMGTFPIVERADREAFGRYRTRDLVLAYMNAVAAGDWDTVVAG